ncbi:MAG: hypothetical protein IPK92_16335 [Nitrospira sp.]|nr:hypothetical protein [Nitrospira sp.]
MTNEKYRAFIEAGGYDNLRHWSEDGWKWRWRIESLVPRIGMTRN